MSWLGVAEGIVDPRAQLHWREASPYWTNGPILAMRERIVQAARAMDGAAKGPGAVLLALDNGPELLLALMACLVGGRTFCIVSTDRAAGLVNALGTAGGGTAWRPDLVVSSTPLPTAGCPVVPPGILLDGPPGLPDGPTGGDLHAAGPATDRLIYLQPTSGSSGIPKLVPVTRRMLKAQCEAIVDRMGASDRDVMVAWPPMSHDMGLMAVLIMLYVGGSYVGSSPAAFRRWPLSWMTDIHHHRATLSTGPSISLKLLSHFLRPGTDLDLSCWRFGWVGAEPVYASVVNEFQETFSPFGLAPNVIRPGYGMAETVVSLSFQAPAAPFRLAPHPIMATRGRDVPLLSNGSPLRGIDVEIWSPRDECLGEGPVGRIMARGDSVSSGYWGMASDLIHGWRDTGDLGFLKDGDVYVVGRAKDVVIRGGVNHAAEDLEQTVRRSLEDDLVRLAAFSVIDHQAAKEWFHVVIEARRGMEDRRAAITRHLVERHALAPDFIHFVEKGAIPVTSSGKVRRQLLREAYAEPGTGGVQRERTTA